MKEPLPPSKQIAWKPRVIEIIITGDRGFSVRDGLRIADSLGWDEMLGHVAAMTIPCGTKARSEIYSMKTEQEMLDYERHWEIQRIRNQMLSAGYLDKSPFDTWLD